MITLWLQIFKTVERIDRKMITNKYTVKKAIAICLALTMAAGVFAFLYRTFVTWFTRMSVHCALSTTATSNVKGLV